MNAYIYNADIYCEDCGIAIKQQIRAEARAAKTKLSEYVELEDSDSYPQWASDGGGEADCPQHCGSHGACLNAFRPKTESDIGAGAFLENPLTTHGYDYVREAINEFHTSGRGCEDVLRLWAEHYDIEFEPATKDEGAEA